MSKKATESIYHTIGGRRYETIKEIAIDYAVSETTAQIWTRRGYTVERDIIRTRVEIRE